MAATCFPILALLEVMEAFVRSSQSGAHITIETRPDRQAPLAESLVDSRLA